MAEKDNNADTILLSAGGTGGHMFPAQALAADLLPRGYNVVLATDERGRKFGDKFGPDVPVHVLPAGTLGAGFMGKVKGGMALSFGIAKAFALIKKIRPKAVVGFGGYPSFPPVYAAQKLGVPTILHEQNAVPGKANAMLAGNATRIAISYPDISGLGEAERVRCVVTGNPVRAEIAALYTKPYAMIREGGPVNILIIGGSLGASVFSDVAPRALAKLHGEYRARLNVMQQCREENIETARSAYAQAGINATVQPFFDNMAELLDWAHLVISRSGASSVAEITAAGRPAIFVPYPHHADQQQKINADSVADRGGAWTIVEDGFTPDVLSARLETFLQAPQTLFQAAEAARLCGKPDAARRLGNLVTAVASGW